MTDPLPSASSSWLTEQRKRVIGAVLAAAVIGGLYLRVCQYCGHLARELGYDDVMYAIDGASRLLVAADYGLTGMIKSFWQAAPHSPLSTLLAMAGFVLGGVNETALYAINIVLLMIAAVFVVAELRDTRRTMLALCLAFVLMSPLGYRLIEESRPDMALGLATAIMGWWFTGGLVRGEARLFKKAGLALGACLLIKPAFFVHTLAMAGVLTGLFVLAQLAKRLGVASLAKSGLANLGWFFGLGLVVAAPYFAKEGVAIFHYFWDNAVGAHHAERCLPAACSLLDVLSIFFREWNFFGSSLGVIAAAAIGATVWLAWRGAKPEALRLAAFGVMAVASLCVMLVGRHNNPFFLATFQWSVLLAATFAIASLDALARGAWQPRLRIACAVCGVFFVFSKDPWWRTERVTALKSDAALREGAEWNRKLFDLVEKHQESLRESNRLTSNGYWTREVFRKICDPSRALLYSPDHGDPPPQVFFSFTGDVNANTFQWEGLKRGVLPDTSCVLSSELAQSIVLAKRSEYTVLASKSATIDRLMLNFAVQDDFGQWLVTNPDFAKLPDASPDPRYAVYVNQKRVPVVVAWSGRSSDQWVGLKSSFTLLSCARDFVQVEVNPLTMPNTAPNRMTVKIGGVPFRQDLITSNRLLRVKLPAAKLTTPAVVEFEFDRSYTPESKSDTRQLAARIRLLN